ncbi:peptide-methionine (S)-S-oxide reductase, partial [Vibrio parahaemolyticus]|uniref:peptide-methionine (S)-S-oxide reductase n=1 Tax=Vibrio parahaemolyticus TaxID=670 RepID=UPI001A8F241A
LNKQTLISIEDALPGRDQPMQIDAHHFVNKSNLKAPLASHQQQILLGMGCFWGAERVFWQLDGVVSTSVGYAGGYTPNPTH